MPLNKDLLANDILNLFDDESDIDVDPKAARKRQAERLADAIYRFVQLGDVNTVVTGTSVSGGAVTATGKGKVT